MTSSAVSTFLNSSGNEDVLLYFFYDFDPKKDKEMRTVCRRWNVYATKAFKHNMISAKQLELEQKMDYLLRSTGKKITDLCPGLKTLWVERDQLSLWQVNHRAYYLTEKHYISLKKCFIVETNPCTFMMKGAFKISKNNFKFEEQQQTSETSQETEIVKNEIHGKAFCEFESRLIVYTPYSCRKEVESKKPRINEINYLPIELFNLKVHNENNNILTDYKTQNCCIPFKGKIIELIVDEKTPTIATIKPIVDPATKFYIPERDVIPSPRLDPCSKNP